MKFPHNFEDPIPNLLQFMKKLLFNQLLLLVPQKL